MVHEIFIGARGLSCQTACRILVPQPGTELASLALQGGFLISGQIRKVPQICPLRCVDSWFASCPVSSRVMPCSSFRTVPKVLGVSQQQHAEARQAPELTLCDAECCTELATGRAEETCWLVSTWSYWQPPNTDLRKPNKASSLVYCSFGGKTWTDTRLIIAFARRFLQKYS